MMNTDAGNSLPLVGPGARVTLHFALKFSEDEVIESTFGGAAVSLVMGDGTLPAGFERCLLGMAPGTRQTFHLPPDQAFGEHRDKNVHRLERRRFGDTMALEKGLVVSFASPGGGELPGVVCGFDEQHVTVDFNHPLAGRALEFDVAVEAVTLPEPPGSGADSAAKPATLVP